MRTYLPLVMVGLIVLAGCSQDKQPVVAVPAQPAPTNGVGDHGNVPADLLGKSETAYKEAKAAYDKAPTDAAAKTKYVAATVQFGTANMMSETLDRKVKYKEALKYYKVALKLDPKNAEALSNKEMIEGIYKQMGRPIPE